MIIDNESRWGIRRPAQTDDSVFTSVLTVILLIGIYIVVGFVLWVLAAAFYTAVPRWVSYCAALATLVGGAEINGL